jgi:spermidine synthase
LTDGPGAAEHLRSDIPTGRAGRWRVERFDLEGPGDGDTRPHWAQDPGGSYTRLMHEQVLYMTDMYAEIYTQRIAVQEAWDRGGEVLLTGLGLGLVAEAMLRSSDVVCVTIVEAAAEVVELVAPHLEDRYGSRLRVVHADAFAWLPEPGTRFAVGWHDIWPIPQDPVALGEALVLEERFAAVCDWQGSWPAEYIAAEHEPSA